MILDGVLVGVLLAGLELGVAWILAVITNHGSIDDNEENKNKITKTKKFSTTLENLSNSE